MLVLKGLNIPNSKRKKWSYERKGVYNGSYKIDYEHLKNIYNDVIFDFHDTKSSNGLIKPAIRHFSEWYSNTYTTAGPNAVYKALSKIYGKENKNT